MQSKRFIDQRTGEIVTQVPLSKIQFFEEYDGPCEAGEFDNGCQHEWGNNNGNMYCLYCGEDGDG